MPSGRSDKRARKKERRNTRREEWARAIKRRRRQRLGVMLASLAIIAVGFLIAFFAFNAGDEEETPAAQETEAAARAVPLKRPVACDAKLPATAGSRKRTYTSALDQKLDKDKTYIWRLETSCGDIDIELDVDRAPKTSNSIVFLTREKFFDGTFFHRVNEGFVVQGGDPEGSGSGGAGYDVVEAPPSDLSYEAGIVAMAKAGTDPPGSSSSQFFIVTGKEGEVLRPEYALLGRVVKGMDAARKMEKLGEAEDGPPSEWPYIERATIVEK